MYTTLPPMRSPAYPRPLPGGGLRWSLLAPGGLYLPNSSKIRKNCQAKCSKFRKIRLSSSFSEPSL